MKKFLNILIAIVLVVQTLFVVYYRYLSIGYTFDDFQSFSEYSYDTKIEKFTYTYGEWEGEYVIDSQQEERMLVSYLTNLRLFVNTDAVPFEIMTKKATGAYFNHLQVYMTNGNVYKIQEGTSQTFLGRDYDTVQINGTTYLSNNPFKLELFLYRFADAWREQFSAK